MYEDKTVAVIDYRAGGEIIENLKKLNIHVVTTRRHDTLSEPVNGHPDMVMFKDESSGIIVCPEEYNYYEECLQPFNIKILKGCNELGNKYPGNIRYNGVLNGNVFFHKVDSTDARILDMMKGRNIKCINVNQGYTKCSTVTLGSGGIITSDAGIMKAAVEEGFDALLISSGYIGLDGYDYGFIGGSTGFVDNTLYFTGRIDKHPDCREIMRFLYEKGIETVFLSNKCIYDLGTIIFLKQGEECEK
ncbi:hypothetical protein SAMN02745751_02781 [Dethiosulfatibacter aminovorans DSM 17477]|uniref:DUF6873 domain-containing protein n=1 Tax=Dethiosulfatibacter aminovorans DSM 17477 TaxID=1121476 RepID=A0A1M6K2F9_9FIRM|nr:hypothetical protein [Dethiosulfatibacter aminovorans]SHJ53042.1 hypothetical protein SAMN02745751_02781 [Dethiosulfatibacter aminovorans DSM 17477]